MKFQIISEMKKEKLAKLNREEFKIIRNIIIVIAGAEILLSGILLVYDILSRHINFQDLRNFILGIALFCLLWIFPKVVAYIQTPILKFRHLDGRQSVFVSEDGIEIHSEKYGSKRKYNFSVIERIYDKGTYYKIIVDKRLMFVHKEDFVIGTPEEFYVYINERLKG